MNPLPDPVKKAIRAKVVELASGLGNDARALRYDQSIPETGALDSPALMELILFYEQTFGVSIPQDDLNIDNFGTIDAMAGYLEKARKAKR